jgi:hypothetical protein
MILVEKEGKIYRKPVTFCQEIRQGVLSIFSSSSSDGFVGNHLGENLKISGN